MSFETIQAKIIEHFKKCVDYKNSKRDKQDVINNETATRESMVLPFLEILGYDTYHRNPEARGRSGSKSNIMDYLLQDTNAMKFAVVEIKHDEKQTDGLGQLSSYYASQEHTFVLGILTNGTEYRFYSHIKGGGKMDAEPFYSFSFHNQPSIDKLIQSYEFRALINLILRENVKQDTFVECVKRLKDDINTFVSNAFDTKSSHSVDNTFKNTQQYNYTQNAKQGQFVHKSNSYVPSIQNNHVSKPDSYGKSNESNVNNDNIVNVYLKVGESNGKSFYSYAIVHLRANWRQLLEEIKGCITEKIIVKKGSIIKKKQGQFEEIEEDKTHKNPSNAAEFVHNKPSASGYDVWLVQTPEGDRTLNEYTGRKEKYIIRSKERRDSKNIQ